MKISITLLLSIIIAIFSGCKKQDSDPNNGTIPNNTAVNKMSPDGFNYSTSKNIALNLTLKATNGDPLSGVVVNIYDPTNINTNAAIFRGITNSSGNLTAHISIPASLQKIIIDPSYLGLMRNAQASIKGNSVTATIGGPNGFGGDIIPETIIVNNVNPSDKIVLGLNTPIAFSYPAPYVSTDDAVINTGQNPQSYGVPAYLEPVSDVISASLLSYVNSSLPETKPLPTTHPEYLSNNIVSTINVIARSDVWITFVAEGAGYLSTLAFYTHATGNPPLSEADIKKATIILPNASANGSGGGLRPGNKVKLGTFDSGTSIGFILIAYAWTGKGISINNPKYYSDANLNPETTAELKKHTVALYDDVHKLTLIGFEDQNRQNSSCDNDFNDVVFYASSNPVTAISNANVAVIDKGLDSDGDGVLDALDAFPTDATKAYLTYFPSQNTYASIAFEDNWPTKGDYDLNDLVVKYRYTFTNNAQNQVVSLQGDYSVAAVGASYKNGFGVQLPIAASAVSSVSGQKFKDNYISLAGNGVELGQAKAVIIPFDNSDVLAANPDGAFFVNTLNSKEKITSKTAVINVIFVAPIAASSLSLSAFNPFLISNERRGYEVHLPGFSPTDKADVRFFGAGDDASVPSLNKYYISKENGPWAISFNDQFTYPLESIKVTDCYLHFADWATSGGTLYADWYSSTVAGYRNTYNLFTK